MRLAPECLDRRHSQLAAVREIRTQLRPIQQTDNAQSCFDLIRHAQPPESPFDPLLFLSQRKALCAIQLGPARVRGNSKLKVPPEAQIRIPLRKCLSAYLYDFLCQSGGAAYRIRTCDPIITNDVTVQDVRSPIDWWAASIERCLTESAHGTPEHRRIRCRLR